MRSDLPPDTLRTLSLSLTLSRWTPIPPQAPLANAVSDSQNNGLLASKLSGSRAPLITSASTSPSPCILTTVDSEIRGNSVALSQHATDRFPRFTYLLRNGTLQSESDEGRSRRSADPGGTHASLWAIPVTPAQCGIRDATALQSCAAASTTGICSLADRSSSPSRASTIPAIDPVEPLASAPERHQLRLLPVLAPGRDPASMSNYSPTTSSSRGGARTSNDQQQVLAPTPTRSGVDRIAGERIMPGEPQHAYPAQSLTPTSAQLSGGDDDADGNEYDTQMQDGATTAEGQPKKKKTRRAGVAITRARRMQRDVRRLAEDGEEEAAPYRQSQPTRVRLSSRLIDV